MENDTVFRDSAKIRDAETYEKDLNEALKGTAYSVQIDNKLDFPGQIELKVAGVAGQYKGQRIELEAVKCPAETNFKEMRQLLALQIVEAHLKDPKAEVYVQRAIKEAKASV